jgi:hypothetical protein
MKFVEEKKYAARFIHRELALRCKPMLKLRPNIISEKPVEPLTRLAKQ